MKMKKTLPLLLCLVFLFCSCTKDKTPNILYQAETVNPADGISKIEKTSLASPPVEVDYSFTATTPSVSEMQATTRAVLTGTILQSDELKITFSPTGKTENQEAYITRAKLKVTEVLYDTNKEINVGDLIWFYYSNTTHTHIDVLPMLEKNNEYFMFFTTISLPFFDYGKYVVYYPKDLLLKKDGTHFDFTSILNVFTREDLNINEDVVPTIEIMREFFEGI